MTIESSALKEVLQMIREEFSSQLSIRETRWSEPDYIPEIEADREFESLRQDEMAVRQAIQSRIKKVKMDT